MFQFTWPLCTPPMFKFGPRGFQNWFYIHCSSNQKKVPSAQTFFAPNRSKLGKWTIQNHCALVWSYIFVCHVNESWGPWWATLVLHSPLPQFGPIWRKKSLSGRHFFLVIVTAKIKPVLKHTWTEPSEKGGPSWKTSFKPPQKKDFSQRQNFEEKKKKMSFN